MSGESGCCFSYVDLAEITLILDNRGTNPGKNFCASHSTATERAQVSQLISAVLHSAKTSTAQTAGAHTPER